MYCVPSEIWQRTTPFWSRISGMNETKTTCQQLITCVCSQHRCFPPACRSRGDGFVDRTHQNGIQWLPHWCMEYVRRKPRPQYCGRSRWQVWSSLAPGPGTKPRVKCDRYSVLCVFRARSQYPVGPHGRRWGIDQTFENAQNLLREGGCLFCFYWLGQPPTPLSFPFWVIIWAQKLLVCAVV